MTNSPRSTRFFNLWLKNKTHFEQGFSIIENLVAILILTISFGLNLQFITLLRIQNFEQEIETAAISLSKEVMEDLRYQLQDNINSYNAPSPNRLTRSLSGYDFDIDVYVCEQEPTIDVNQNVTCLNNGNNNDDIDIRYIVVQVIDGGRNNEKLYTVESSFTELR